MTARPPAPLEWHPYYRTMTWLLDWVERRVPYGDLHEIRIPVPSSVRASFNMIDELYPEMPTMRTIVMTRHRAAGPAPYVGRPFHYEWYVGTDHLGRHIAGDSRIVYNWPVAMSDMCDDAQAMP